MRRVLATHPRLQAATKEQAAAEEGVRAARAPAPPTFSIAPWIGSANGTTEEFLFLQPLEVNGARGARSVVAQARREQTAASLELERWALVHAVRVAYDSLAYAQARTALARETLELTRELDRLTRRQVELGTRPGIEATQTRIEVIRAEQAHAQAEGERRAATGALASLMGIPQGESLPALTPLALSVVPPEQTPAGTAPRPELAVEGANQKRLRGEQQLARTELKADLAFVLRSQNLFHPSYPSDRGAAVQVNLPLDWGARRARVRQLEVATEAQSARQEALVRQLQQEQEAARVRLETAAQTLQTYEADLLERTERLLNASKTGFQAGQTSITAVLEAQRTYKTVLAERLAAAYAYAQARTEWERVQSIL